MGWYGSLFFGVTMRQVRERIDEEVGATVVNLKYGVAICVVTEKDIREREWLKDHPDYLNLIYVVLWRKQNDYLMLKTISESMGPCHYDVPLKYVNAICKETMNNEYAVKWRNKVIQYHRAKRKQNKLARAMARGDMFYVYGDLFRYVERGRRQNRILATEVNTGKVYSIRHNQISMHKEVA